MLFWFDSTKLTQFDSLTHHWCRSRSPIGGFQALIPFRFNLPINPPVPVNRFNPSSLFRNPFHSPLSLPPTHPVPRHPTTPETSFGLSFGVHFSTISFHSHLAFHFTFICSLNKFTLKFSFLRISFPFQFLSLWTLLSLFSKSHTALSLSS